MIINALKYLKDLEISQELNSLVFSVVQDYFSFRVV